MCCAKKKTENAIARHADSIFLNLRKRSLVNKKWSRGRLLWATAQANQWDDWDPRNGCLSVPGEPRLASPLSPSPYEEPQGFCSWSGHEETSPRICCAESVLMHSVNGRNAFSERMAYICLYHPPYDWLYEDNSSATMTRATATPPTASFQRSGPLRRCPGFFFIIIFLSFTR